MFDRQQPFVVRPPECILVVRFVYICLILRESEDKMCVSVLEALELTIYTAAPGVRARTGVHSFSSFWYWPIFSASVASKFHE